jgi:hypothetical protein
MKFGKSDLKKVQWSFIGAILAVAVGTAAVLFSLQQTKSAQLARSTATTEHKEFDGKLRQVRNEENEIKQKAAMFSNLQARGVIGDEQRLDWVELLKDIRDKRRLIDLQYEILPQRPLDASPGPGFAFFSSAMKLQLKLLHEEDLTRLLDDLRQQAKALIQVKHCDVSRLPRIAGDRNANLAQLQADCQIDWVTVREVSKK